MYENDETMNFGKQDGLTMENNRAIRGTTKAVVAAVVLMLVVTAGCTGAGEEKSDTSAEQQSRLRAPEFPVGPEWLNTSEPLSLKDLRGKVVLLDFWTYCCINCIHIMPDLKRLEEKYADELVVIGVHSAKFFNERHTENIRQAILRYELRHPVVNDRRLQIWRAYSVRAWPTLVLIDPEGYVVGSRSGEGIYEPFDKAIGALVKEFDARGKIDRSPVAAIDPILDKERPKLLSFPGKVLADAEGGRLFIADSNHNRIVVVSLADNSVLDIAGDGKTGFEDGPFEEATFNKPQGMALRGDTLYVADTENHAVRRLDLKNRTVETIAGTGSQARGFSEGGPAKTTALNSPWDLWLHEDTLFIANAGSHQLWRMDLTTQRVEPHAGSGRENRTDGALRSAALAQPSGLTSDGQKLYFADSEVSAIRAADIDPAGEVTTIAGGELFEFGDVDGRGLEARFQHPLGVAYLDGELFVADTYNNKIRRIDLDTRQVSSFIGSGKEGMNDGAAARATFDEPGGVSIAGGKLYVADTNNHLIRITDLETHEVSTLNILGDAPMLADMHVELSDREPKLLEPRAVSPGAVSLRIELGLPSGTKLNDLAPSSITWAIGDGEPQLLSEPSFPAVVPVGDIAADTTVRIDYSIYYCDAGNEGLCYFAEGSLAVPLHVVESGSNMAGLTITIRENII